MNQIGWNPHISQFIRVKILLKLVAGWNPILFQKHWFHILHFPNSTGLFTKPTGHQYTKYRFFLDIGLVPEDSAGFRIAAHRLWPTAGYPVAAAGRLKCADTTRTTRSSSRSTPLSLSPKWMYVEIWSPRGIGPRSLRPSISGPSTSWQRNKSIPACLPWALIISKTVLVAAWHMPFLGIITMALLDQLRPVWQYYCKWHFGVSTFKLHCNWVIKGKNHPDVGCWWVLASDFWTFVCMGPSWSLRVRDQRISKFLLVESKILDVRRWPKGPDLHSRTCKK